MFWINPFSNRPWTCIIFFFFKFMFIMANNVVYIYAKNLTSRPNYSLSKPYYNEPLFKQGAKNKLS